MNAIKETFEMPEIEIVVTNDEAEGKYKPGPGGSGTCGTGGHKPW